MRLVVCLFSFALLVAGGAVAQQPSAPSASTSTTERGGAGPASESSPAVDAATSSSAAGGQPSKAEGPSRATLERAIETGTIEGKLNALNEGARLSPPDRSALYLAAIDYVLANYGRIRGEGSGQELALSVARLVGTTGADSAAALLWQLFNADSTAAVREAALASLAETAKGKTEVIAKMNLWLATQDTLFKNGGTVDLPVVAACVRTLGALSDPSSFPVLFSASLVHYPKPVDGTIEEAIGSFTGNLADLLVSVILNNPLPEKRAALSFAIADRSLGSGGKGEVAMAALKLALAGPATSADETGILALRFTAVGELERLSWAPATELIVENFDQALSESDQGTLPPDRLLDSIAALGSMGTHEAAVRLSLYLDVLGTYIQSGQSVSVPVVLAVISSLKELRDPVAVENLLSVQYLGYPAAVKQAARQAVENLQALGVGQ